MEKENKLTEGLEMHKKIEEESEIAECEIDKI